MTPVHEAFLTLLRISLSGAGEPPELTEAQWTELFELADAVGLDVQITVTERV